MAMKRDKYVGSPNKCPSFLNWLSENVDRPKAAA
jgi:hypothetical protein